MKCPYCGNKTSVINTVDYGDWIHRRRECFWCFCKYNTVEFSDSMFIELQNEIAKLKRDDSGKPLLSQKAASKLIEMIDRLPTVPKQVSRQKEPKNDKK